MKAIMRDEREMKDSGIAWIGKFPVDWNLSRLKFVSDIIMGQSPSADEIKEVGNVQFMQGNKEFGSRYPSPTLYCDCCSKHSRIGDILMSVRAPVGAINESDKVYGIGRGLCSIRADKINKNFMKYYLLKSVDDLQYYSNGSTFDAVTIGILSNFYLVIPSASEQQTIATYLDDRCGKIDAIIAEAKASIEEYKELKISMVNDAITHGINGTAICDSGVDWIGKIPSNWQIMILKRLFRIKKDIARKEGYTVLSITQRGIVPKNFKESGQFAADYSNYQLVDKGDFAMNHMDLLTGWVDISEYDGVTSPDYRVFIPTGYEEIYKPYYKYVLQNCYSCKIFYGLGHGVAGFGRWRLPKDMFLNFKVPLPPIDEQKEIASYLDDNLQKLNDLILTKQSLIEDLESYKKSLIYEVVTGKRKVVE